MAMADVTIDGKNYQTDTMLHRQIGPGMHHTIVRIPEIPLNVYVLSADLTDPHSRVESTIGHGVVGETERLVSALERNRTETRRPLAACNGNFWIVGGSGEPWVSYAMGTPMGAVVRNDLTFVNTNMTADQWNGGYMNTGASVFTHDHRVHMGHFGWSGIINSAKTGELRFANVNRRGILGEIALWNRAYTSTRQFETNWATHNAKGNCHTDNYYLKFVSGDGWAVNRPMKFIVKEIVKDADRQTLGYYYDACLTASGANAAKMAVLQVGDEIEVSSNWVSPDCNGGVSQPAIESMVEGNATVMNNGVLTPQNYNMEYNSMIYSRTAYGCNTDGTHLYMIVIDKSLSKEYGQSAGCSTATMCQILKSMCPDVTDIVNYDAGGSAEMVVLGEVVNTSTEGGNPRAVACGWMLVAEGEEDNEVASIQFEDYHVKLPTYSSYVPKILGYNKIGEHIDQDVKGFTLSCDETIGAASGDTHIAGKEVTTGTLTATLGGMTCSVPVTTLAAQPAIAIKPTILIDDRTYPVEVKATVLNNTYSYNPAHLQWNIDNVDVATMTNGTLKGVKNGDAHLTCIIGELVDEADVKVEISSTPTIDQTWDGFTFKQSGASNLVLSEDGVLTFKSSSSRAPYISLKKDITFYSLPDSIVLTFNSSIPIDYIQLDTRNEAFGSQNYVKYDVDGGFQAGQDYTINVDLAAMGGVDKVSTYPISIREIKFTPAKGAPTGQQSITFKKFYSHYSPAPAIAGDVDGNGVVDVSDANILTNIILGKDTADNYNGRADVDGNGVVDVSDCNFIINTILGK